MGLFRAQGVESPPLNECCSGRLDCFWGNWLWWEMGGVWLGQGTFGHLRSWEKSHFSVGFLEVMLTFNFPESLAQCQLLTKRYLT